MICHDMGLIRNFLFNNKTLTYCNKKYVHETYSCMIPSFRSQQLFQNTVLYGKHFCYQKERDEQHSISMLNMNIVSTQYYKHVFKVVYFPSFIFQDCELFDLPPKGKIQY